MADSHARIGIYVNGERVIDDMVDHSEELYTVFESDEPQDVTVTFVKLSESPHSTIAVTDINVTGTPIQPTPNKEKLIEFIGDSITCGYGADDPDKSHQFSTKTEDVTKAFAYKTAQAAATALFRVTQTGKRRLLSRHSRNITQSLATRGRQTVSLLPQISCGIFPSDNLKLSLSISAPTTTATRRIIRIVRRNTARHTPSF